MYNNAKNWIKTNKKLSYSIFAGLLIIIIGSALYGFGYRLKENFTLGKMGGVELNLALANTNVYLDEKEKIYSEKENNTLNIPLSPRKHSIIVHHEGYFPWKKDLEIPSGESIKSTPIFILQNPSGFIITKNDPEYYNLKNKIQKYSLPTENNPIISSDGTTKLWVADNEIITAVGSTTIGVIQPETVVRNVSFYKDRNDYVIFSTSGSVFVIEINEVGGRNFMSIYSGVKPYFIQGENNFIYVLDQDNLMQVAI